MASVDVPGRVAASDKQIVSSVYELISRSTSASTFVSTLRVVDTLVSRFIFQIGNPKDLDLSTIRNLVLKLSNARSIVFDLPRRAVLVECWRESHADKRGKKKGTKRKRDVEIEIIETLPEYIESELAEVSPSLAAGVPVLRSIMLWILNREEDFCEFQFVLVRNEMDELFDVTLKSFDAFTFRFVKELVAQFKTFVRDILVDWSSQSLVLRVTR